MHDIPRDIRNLIAGISQQPDGHRENWTQDVLSALHRAALIPENPHWWFEQQGEVIPHDWLAFEVGLFDNGEDRKPVDSRNRIRTSMTRYAANLKFHFGKVETFDPSRRPGREFGISFFEATAAVAATNVISENIGDGGKRLTLLAADLIAASPGVEYVGVMRAKSNGKLGRYLRDFVVGLSFRDGYPHAMAVVTRKPSGDVEPAVSGLFSDELPNGKPLPGTVIGAIRATSQPGELIGWTS